MSGRIHERFYSLVLATVLGALLLASGVCAEEVDAADDRWVPSIGVGVLVQTSSASGSGSTSWPDCTPTSAESVCFGGRPDAAGNSDFIAGIPDLRLGLVAPPIRILSSELRPFTYVGWQFGWGYIETEEAVATEGGFGDILIPTLDENPDNVGGVGSRMFAKTSNGWFAGLGLAIDFPVGEYDFRLLPSIDYLGQRVSVRAQSRRVAELVSPVPPAIPGSPDLSRRADFRFEEISGKDSKVLHSVGLRLGLETEMGRVGPVAINGYAEIATLWLLGDREVEVRAGGEGAGDFRMDLDSTIVQGGLGVRFAWAPERKSSR